MPFCELCQWNAQERSGCGNVCILLELSQISSVAHPKRATNLAPFTIPTIGIANKSSRSGCHFISSCLFFNIQYDEHTRIKRRESEGSTTHKKIIIIIGRGIKMSSTHDPW